jgi:hypothetical protein
MKNMATDGLRGDRAVRGRPAVEGTAGAETLAEQDPRCPAVSANRR